MAKLGFQKPNLSQGKNASIQVIGGVMGYKGYDAVASKIPMTREIEAGVFAGSVLAQTMLKGSGIGKTIASAILLGISINTGMATADNFGLLEFLKPQTPRLATADELKGLLGGWEHQPQVEYLENTIDIEHADLSGMQDNSDLM